VINRSPAEPAAIRTAPRWPYLSLMLNAAQQAVAYRSRILLSILGNGVWIVAVYYLWRAVFANGSQLAGYDWGAMRTYLVLAYAINALLSFSSTARLYNLVRTGDVAQELLRPVDYLAAQLAIALGGGLIEGLVSAALALVVAALAVGVAPPASPAAALLFLPSIALGFVIKFLISFLAALLCFWTVNGVGLIWAQTAVVNLFSGALVPLAFFPDWLRTLAAWAPFQGIVATPLAIYQGQAVGWELAGAVTLQMLWAAMLWALARALWGPATRALDIQGG
jgi:ABC-2 type transport system permease protein